MSEPKKQPNETENKKLISSLKKVFGTVYFVQGTSSFSALSVFYYMKEVLKMGPVEGQIFQGLTQVAWYIKPLWGFISDKIKLFGYRRKTYFILMALLALISWLLIGLFAYLEVHWVLIYLILFNLAMSGYAFVDVVTDALMVEHGQRLKRVGSFVNFQWKLLAISSMLVGLSSGYLQQQIQLTQSTGQGLIDYWLVFALTGIFPLATAYVGIKHAPEKRDESYPPFQWRKIPFYLVYGLCYPAIGIIRLVNWLAEFCLQAVIYFLLALTPNNWQNYCQNRWGVVLPPWLRPARQKAYSYKFKEWRARHRYFWLLILFILFWNFSPSIGYVSQSYFVDKLNFQPMHFGVLRAIGGIVWLLSIIAYSRFVKRFNWLKWSHYLYAMVGLGIVSLAVNYLFYLPPQHWAWQWNTLVSVIHFGLIAVLGILLWQCRKWSLTKMVLVAISGTILCLGIGKFLLLTPFIWQTKMVPWAISAAPLFSFQRVVGFTLFVGWLYSLAKLNQTLRSRRPWRRWAAIQGAILVIGGCILFVPHIWQWWLQLKWSSVLTIIGWQEGMSWNRYQLLAFFTDLTIGFANIPAFIIPLTICGQLISGRNAGMLYALLMSLSNLTGSLGSLVGGGLYSLFSSEWMRGFVIAFCQSPFNLAGANPQNEKLVILQLFVYISALFTVFTVPFIRMLEKELDRRQIKIYLDKE
ncbi:hypothetical protein D6821_00605 [Candidatus Parcubacteria bacterium]|nr:MAG: hypothetical protein D6821_00605 [Candidatus Parcubacteria bacterium]